MVILVLNPGSSTLKAALIEPPGTTRSRTEVPWTADASRSRDRAAGLADALARLGLDTETGGGALDGVGYRVVHGGSRFVEPTRIDDEVLDGIRAVSDLAPLHNDVALETVEAGRRLLPGLPHVACFDTAFHATLPEAAYRYPVPGPWYEAWGVRRFGFHGLSVGWAVGRASQLLERDSSGLRLVVAHLGSGCSVTAVDGGRSVDTSMGLTPLEGLMMGTRSGSIDPNLPLYLVGRGRLDVETVDDALDHGSGLLGVSGRSSDMRELEEAAQGGDAPAALAITMFVHRAAAWIAYIATSLPQLDALVFTGGIGEHAHRVRGAIVERLGVLGLAPLHSGQGDIGGDARLDAGGGPVAVLVVEAREDLVIAAATAARIG